MTLTDGDLQLFASRVRAHFAPALRDAAERLAYVIATFAGAEAKKLRPETTVKEIFQWVKARQDSLNLTEFVMMFEEEARTYLPDQMTNDAATFRDWVEMAAQVRR